MAHPDRARRLIVNADDFGKSHAINQAVIRAHREGILTSASLMVSGEAAEEAAELARQEPKLGVGLHLTLVCGRSCFNSPELTQWVGGQSRFADEPVLAGFRYFFQRRCHAPLEREIAGQFERFRATGLSMDHVNGHLHFHMHPTILRILMRHAREWNIGAIRVTRDPICLNLRLSRGRYGYRLRQGLVFWTLAGWMKLHLREKGIKHTDQVFGLLQNEHVDARYVERLIPRLPPGDSELYSHPSLDEFNGEFEALTAPRVRALAEQHGVRFARYQDL